MSHRPRVIVASLAALAATAASSSGMLIGEDRPIGAGPGGNSSAQPRALPALPGVGGSSGAFSEINPGKPFGISGRQMTVSGYLDLDGLRQHNYTDADNENADSRGRGLMRTEIGFGIKTDESIEVNINLGYHAEFGGEPANAPGTTSNRVNGDVVVERASVRFNQLFEMPSLNLDVGRMKEVFNLRENHGGFLFDSRADDRDVTGWDGLEARYGGIDGVVISGYVFRLPDTSQLYGIEGLWRPTSSGGNRLTLVGSANLQRDVRFTTAVGPGAATTIGDGLQSYYGGLRYLIDTVELFGEGALQRGDADAGRSFSGYGISGGVDVQLPQEYNHFEFGVQGDLFSGQKQGSGDVTSFVNTWEGVSDTYIVESEKYGEVGRFIPGNLQALKVRLKIGFDQADTVTLTGVFADYRFEQSPVGGGRSLGQEFDLTLKWDYANNAKIRLFGAYLKPGSGLTPVLPSTAAGDDHIYMYGVNLLTEF